MPLIKFIIGLATTIQAIHLHQFSDSDVFAYSNLVADGLNINVLEDEAKKEVAVQTRKDGMKAIEDTPSIIEYSQTIADETAVPNQKNSAQVDENTAV